LNLAIIRSFFFLSNGIWLFLSHSRSSVQKRSHPSIRDAVPEIND